MAELIETRWRRYGKDRVYVKTVDGVDVGHVDLVARSVVSTGAAFELELKDCLRRWIAIIDAAPSVVAAAVMRAAHATVGDLADLNVEVPVLDLAANIAGAAARAKRNEVNAEAPVKNFVARLLGVKTDERAWRVGAKGEEKVAGELLKLGPAWRVLQGRPSTESGYAEFKIQAHEALPFGTLRLRDAVLNPCRLRHRSEMARRPHQKPGLPTFDHSSREPGKHVHADSERVQHRELREFREDRVDTQNARVITKQREFAATIRVEQRLQRRDRADAEPRHQKCACGLLEPPVRLSEQSIQHRDTRWHDPFATLCVASNVHDSTSSSTSQR